MTAEPDRTIEADAKGGERVCLPRHVAFIMDGNGRWATSRGLSRTDGHRQGLETLRKVIRHAGKRGIEVITIYSFSSENWSRPEPEVKFLMGLLRRFVQRDLSELHKANVRIRIIGKRDDLEPGILKLLKEAEDITRENSGLQLVVAFNYGSRQEITAAAKSLCEKVARGELVPADISDNLLSSHLDTHDIPDPDLIVRTSGELRLSNFLLWQAAYSEFYFTDLNWPEFDEAALDEALESFGGRDRRFGGLSASAV